MSRAFIQLDSQALRHNIQRCRDFAPNQDIIAMVKSNAYGHGLGWVATVLGEEADVMGVAYMEEAIPLRDSGYTGRCMIFQGISHPDEIPQLEALQIECVIHCKQQLDWFTQHPPKTPLRVWIKLDTGMHRLGFLPEDFPEVLQSLQSSNWVRELSVLTHLACANKPTDPYNQKQLDLFNHVLTGVDSVKRSIANSAAMIAFPETHVGAVRPGIMIYGVSPFPQTNVSADHNLRPVMRFSTQISVIQHFPKGAKVGYSCTWTAQRTSKIAVIPVGYGDGYPRHISDNTPVWINGHFVPIVGRVSMDMITIDVTDLPHAKEGDEVELWGPNLPIETIANAANTIPYELLCQVTMRSERVYI